ncbi:hypothetical protein N9R58_04600 [Gammaproteobacteria bacterium]|nr:hypothetical protein [Gammaproteobacteria bacterium]
MVKLFNSLVLFFFVFSISAATPGQREGLNLKQIKPFSGVDAQVHSIRATKDGISLTKIKIAKPSSSSLAGFKLLTPRDQFALRVLDKGWFKTNFSRDLTILTLKSQVISKDNK